MPDAHARLAPSSAHRWLACPASIRMKEELGNEVDNRFTREGTLAHTRAELEVSHTFGRLSTKAYKQELGVWRRAVAASGGGEDDFDLDDMEYHAREYVAAIQELCDTLDSPTVRAEMQVNVGVDDCWGTSDAIILSRGRVDVWDYKYGSGLLVLPADNPQLKLYGLGALEEYDLLGQLDDVVLHIYQPRVGETAWRTWPTTADELYAWRDTVVIPAARLTADPDAPFGPSAEACKWCPASGLCRAQLETVVAADFETPVDTLGPEELAEALALAPFLKVWLEALEKQALAMAYDKGRTIPGYLVVPSGGRRYITDHKAAADHLAEEGLEPDTYLAPQKLTTLGALEKLRLPGQPKTAMALLTELGLVKKSEGKLSLVPEEKARGRKSVTPATQAAEDFSEE